MRQLFEVLYESCLKCFDVELSEHERVVHTKGMQSDHRIRWHPIVVRRDHGKLGEFTPSYILHTHAFGTYLLGGGYLPCRKDYKVMVFYM